MKRGQVTIFIVLGILIVSLVAIGYAFREQISTKASELGLMKTEALPPQFEEKQAQVEECLGESLNSALYLISTQGGYADGAPGGFYTFAGTPIAYYFDKGANNMPTKEKVASEIAKAMKEEAASCAAVIEAAEPDKATAKVTIGETKVEADVTMAVPVTVNGVTETISDFETSTHINLNKALKTAGEIIVQQATDPENICVTCINDIAIANNVEVELGSYENVILVTITDKNSLIDEMPFEFTFAMRY